MGTAAHWMSFLSQTTFMPLVSLHYCLVLLTLLPTKQLQAAQTLSYKALMSGDSDQSAASHSNTHTHTSDTHLTAVIWAVTVIAVRCLMKYGRSAPYLICQLLVCQCCDSEWGVLIQWLSVQQCCTDTLRPPRHSSCTRRWSNSQNTSQWNFFRKIYINVLSLKNTGENLCNLDLCINRSLSSV